MGTNTNHHDSQTVITDFVGKHLWMIKNWKSWVGCSEKPVIIHSEVFTIPIVDEEGQEKLTHWQIKAFPKRYAQENKDMLAFRLVCLSKHVPKGSFHFETVTPSALGGHTSTNKFKPLPLDAAYHWMTCIRLHPGKDLIMKVKIKIVVANPRGISRGQHRAKRMAVELSGADKAPIQPKYEDVMPYLKKIMNTWKCHLISQVRHEKH